MDISRWGHRPVCLNVYFLLVKKKKINNIVKSQLQVKCYIV